MSNEGIFPSGDPSIMEVMADHWLVKVHVINKVNENENTRMS
jgi:hypothetical protein